MFTRFLAGPLLIVAVVFAISSPAPGQPNRGGGWDPKARFDKMADGKDYLVISEVDERFRERMVKFARDNNITNDKMTFEQYKSYSEQRAKEGGFGFKKGGGGKGGSKEQTKDPSNDAKPSSSPSRPALAEKAPSNPSITSRTVSDDELERRPVVYRAGKLPPGLPDWFEKLDKDKDGQIDLGEWRLAGKEIAEFKRMDLNSDGLLTPNEVLRYLANADKVQPSEDDTLTSGADSISPISAKSESKDGSDDGGKSDKASNRSGRKKGR